MPEPTTGVDFLVFVNTGTLAAPTWTKVGGQRNGRLSRRTDEANLTSKDTAGWHKGKPAINNWSIDFDGLIMEGDGGQEALEEAWRGREMVQVDMVTEGGTHYRGMATITELTDSSPYDSEATYSGTLTGSEELEKV